MMKKRLFLLLSVFMIFIAGCGNRSVETEGRETEVTEQVETTESPEETAETEEAEREASEETEPEKETEVSGEESKETGTADVAEDTRQQEAVQAAESTAAPEQAAAQESTTVTPEPTQAPEPTLTPEPTPEQPAYTPASYDPNTVCSMAVAKCQAGGMITTTDNLASLLAEGSITQDEYNSYYPYDGLGYYSVFVETDLNEASTTSGRKLGSVEGIADYIADMMMLETDPLFNIEYAGIYSLNGTDFYEFRCYR